MLQYSYLDTACFIMLHFMGLLQNLASIALCVAEASCYAYTRWYGILNETSHVKVN